MSSMPTTGWWRTRRSHSPNTSTSPGRVPSTRPKPAGTAAGSVVGQQSGPFGRVVACRGVGRARSPVRRRCTMRSNRLFGPDLAESTLIHNGIDVDAWPFASRDSTTGGAEPLFVRPARIREGPAGRHRSAAPRPADAPGHHAHRRRGRDPAGLATGGRPQTSCRGAVRFVGKRRPRRSDHRCLHGATPSCSPAGTNPSESSRWRRRRPATAGDLERAGSARRSPTGHRPLRPGDVTGLTSERSAVTTHRPVAAQSSRDRHAHRVVEGLAWGSGRPSARPAATSAPNAGSVVHWDGRASSNVRTRERPAKPVDVHLPQQ